MRQRFLQVLESDEKEVSDDALGGFWPRAKKLTRPEKGVLVDLTTWAAQRRTPSTTR
jgi:hypothetical protein